MKPVSTRREGMPMPGAPDIYGPQAEAYGLMAIPDDHGGRFRSQGAGGTFTLDVLIERRDAVAFKNAETNEERQAVLDRYIGLPETVFDSKVYHIPKGALLGSTLVYVVEEVSRASTLDL
jgi:hypothetical protein